MRVKLIKGYSYTRGDITVKRDIPVEMAEEQAKIFISSGYCSAVEDIPNAKPQNEPVSEENSGKNNVVDTSNTHDLSKMSVSELDVLADELGVAFEKGLNKADKIKRINEHLAVTDI